MHLGDLVGIDDVTDVGRGEIFGARRAFAPSAGVGVVVAVGSGAALDVVREGLAGVARRAGQAPQRGARRRPASRSSTCIRRMPRPLQ